MNCQQVVFNNLCPCFKQNCRLIRTKVWMRKMYCHDHHHLLCSQSKSAPQMMCFFTQAWYTKLSLTCLFPNMIQLPLVGISQSNHVFELTVLFTWFQKWKTCKHQSLSLWMFCVKVSDTRRSSVSDQWIFNDSRQIYCCIVF